MSKYTGASEDNNTETASQKSKTGKENAAAEQSTAAQSKETEAEKSTAAQSKKTAAEKSTAAQSKKTAAEKSTAALNKSTSVKKSAASASKNKTSAKKTSKTSPIDSKNIYKAASNIKAGNRIWFCNVDCGDFILVESGGHWGLIDSGERTDRYIQDSNGMTYSVTWGYYRTGEEAMKWAIENLGVTHLDFIIVTHAHSDHIGGVPYIATMYAYKNNKITPLVDKSTIYIRKPYLHINALNDDLAGAVDPNGWHNQAYWYQAEKAMKEHGAKIIDISQGKVVTNSAQGKNNYSKIITAIKKANPVFKNLKYKEGSYNNWYDDRFDLTFKNLRMSLYNLFITPSTYDANVNSIAAVIRYGTQKIFTAGDLNVDNKAEQRVVKAVAKTFGTFQVVKSGHHGYDGSNSKQLLDLFQPKSMIVTNTVAYSPVPSPSEDYARGRFGTRYYMVGETANALAFDLKNGSIKQYVKEKKALGSASGVVKQTWHNANGWVAWTDSWNPGVAGWVYYTNGALVRNHWHLENGEWYYLDAYGYMAKGLTKIGNQTFFMNSSGAMRTGWQWANNAWHYFNPVGGAMLCGRHFVDGYWYFFDYRDGRITTGWQLIGNQWYYFTVYGNSGSGWLCENGHCFYLDAEGRMLTGWQEIGGIWYFFKPNGHMAVNEWYDGLYFDSYGIYRYIANGS